jgi:hypothetical protein
MVEIDEEERPQEKVLSQSVSPSGARRQLIVE